MLAKRIIPCLDVKDGRVVKGVRFVDLRDAGDPGEIARRYDREEADELVFLDITASHEKRDILIDVVRKTAEQVFMPLTVGGGIRTIEDIRSLLLAGADKVSINTAAVAAPHFISRAAEKFGTQCIVVAIDAKRVHGSLPDTAGEKWFEDRSLQEGRLGLPGKVPSGSPLEIPPLPPLAKGGRGDLSGGGRGLWAISTHGGGTVRPIGAV